MSDERTLIPALFAEGLGLLAYVVLAPVIAVYGAVLLSFLFVLMYAGADWMGVAPGDATAPVRWLDAATFGLVGWILGDGDLLKAAPRLFTVIGLVSWGVSFVQQRRHGTPPPKPVLETVKRRLRLYLQASAVLIAAWFVLLLVLPYANATAMSDVLTNTVGMTVAFVLLLGTSLVPVGVFLVMDVTRTNILARIHQSPQMDPDA